VGGYVEAHFYCGIAKKLVEIGTWELNMRLGWTLVPSCALHFGVELRVQKIKGQKGC
jgi:hypothetical protein